MTEKKTDLEWTLPVVDLQNPSSAEHPGIANTGAWASYAIGVVTKNLLKDEAKKKFPLIDEDEHPAHLTLKSSENN